MLKYYDIPFERLYVTEISIFVYSFLGFSFLYDVTLISVIFSVYHVMSHLTRFFCCFIKVFDSVCLFVYDIILNLVFIRFHHFTSRLTGLFIIYILFNILVICNSMRTTVSIIVHFPENGNNFVFTWFLSRKIDEIYHLWRLNFSWRLLRLFTL